MHTNIINQFTWADWFNIFGEAISITFCMIFVMSFFVRVFKTQSAKSISWVYLLINSGACLLAPFLAYFRIMQVIDGNGYETSVDKWVNIGCAIADTVAYLSDLALCVYCISIKIKTKDEQVKIDITHKKVDSLTIIILSSIVGLSILGVIFIQFYSGLDSMWGLTVLALLVALSRASAGLPQAIIVLKTRNTYTLSLLAIFSKVGFGIINTIINFNAFTMEKTITDIPPVIDTTLVVLIWTTILVIKFFNLKKDKLNKNK